METINFDCTNDYSNDYSYDRITETIIVKYNEMLYKLFTEGLKLKGFCFNDRYEMIEFIKSNCTCEDSHIYRIYYVNGIEFLLLREQNIETNNPFNHGFNYKYGFGMTIKYNFL